MITPQQFPASTSLTKKSGTQLTKQNLTQLHLGVESATYIISSGNRLSGITGMQKICLFQISLEGFFLIYSKVIEFTLNFLAKLACWM